MLQVIKSPPCHTKLSVEPVFTFASSSSMALQFLEKHGSHFYRFRNKKFLWDGVVSTTPNTQLGGPVDYISLASTL
jgi:hypothetical protein